VLNIQQILTCSAFVSSFVLQRQKKSIETI